MPSLEATFDRACAERTIPGAVLCATNASGTFTYASAFGTDPSAGPLTPDTVFLLASCTKLLTSIAALQCVERGLVSLDADTATHLPELAALQILDGFDAAGAPKTVPRQGMITLRHLLTHTSGLGYDFLAPKLQKYQRATRRRPGGKTLLARFTLPLLFEPGASWCYGPSIDWAGRLVERLTGMDLEAYFHKHILGPVGARDLTFWPDKRPDLAARRTGVAWREGAPAERGKVVPYKGPLLNDGVTECLGGQGCSGSMTAFVKVLRSLLADDGKLLGKDMSARMFEPQLGDAPRRWLNGLRAMPEVWAQFPGHYPPGIELDWGLAGMITCAKDEGWRGKGTMMWSGLPNLFWFVDRDEDICGVLGTQVLPTGDAQVRELTALFEQAMYKRSKAAKI